jgi:hypothetical protein
MLQSFGWHRKNGDPGEYIYKKDMASLDEFRIRLTEMFIVVAVPIRGSEFLYATKVTSFFKATEFVEQHLLNYEKATNCIQKKPTAKLPGQEMT